MEYGHVVLAKIRNQAKHACVCHPFLSLADHLLRDTEALQGWLASRINLAGLEVEAGV